jgi:hypothetical protein
MAKNEKEFLLRQQTSCRNSREIFLQHKVFNISVDKLVEKGLSSKANYTIVSSLMRFALFLGNTGQNVVKSKEVEEPKNEIV